jgi:hypothetical protein
MWSVRCERSTFPLRFGLPGLMYSCLIPRSSTCQREPLWDCRRPSHVTPARFPSGYACQDLGSQRSIASTTCSRWAYSGAAVRGPGMVPGPPPGPETVACGLRQQRRLPGCTDRTVPRHSLPEDVGAGPRFAQGSRFRHLGGRESRSSAG